VWQIEQERSPLTDTERGDLVWTVGQVEQVGPATGLALDELHRVGLERVPSSGTLDGGPPAGLSFALVGLWVPQQAQAAGDSLVHLFGELVSGGGGGKPAFDELL
jgi:hypothetical protein